jgi:crotonobetainyl-CoA:carnitine CoA-transferase CaiB-like acyl-CoA transferase
MKSLSNFLVSTPLSCCNTSGLNCVRCCVRESRRSLHPGRPEWVEVFGGTDACVTPVLSLAEAARHEHQASRNGFIDIAGVRQPAPAPRFSRTSTNVPAPLGVPGEDTDRVLARFGYTGEAIDVMKAHGVVRSPGTRLQS